MEKNIIISDWFSEIFAYQMPISLIKDIKKQFGYEIRNFDDINNLPVKNVQMYFGNLQSEDRLDKFPSLKWVHFGSAGIDKLSEDYISKRGLTITNIGDINSRALATFIAGEILSSTKIKRLNKKLISLPNITRHDFNIYFKDFIEPQDCKIGILGFGKTTEILICFLENIFPDIRVLSSRDSSEHKGILTFKQIEHEKFLKGLTHLVNLLPFTQSYERFINSNFLKSIVNPLYYINVGRSETQVNHDIRLAALEGKIWGASLDVHGLQGGKISKDFIDLPNFFLTPHISGWTNKFWQKNSILVKYNLEKFSKESFAEMRNIKFIEGERVDIENSNNYPS